MNIKPVSTTRSYHAHIYFNGPAQRAAAMTVREAIAARFEVQMGRVHDALIGPHAQPMYQVAFAVAQFPALVPWLMLNRAGLAILIHPNTGNAYEDHVTNALWLGEKLPIMNLEWLASLKEEVGVEAVVPNTTPHLAA